MLNILQYIGKFYTVNIFSATNFIFNKEINMEKLAK